MLFRMLLATDSPFALACWRPRVTDAPSPMAREAFDAGAEVFVYDNFVGIEFNFHAVKQCLIAGDTRCYFVEGFDHLGNVDHDTVREYQERSPGTASFKVGIRLLRHRRSSVVLLPRLKSPYV